MSASGKIQKALDLRPDQNDGRTDDMAFELAYKTAVLVAFRETLEKLDAILAK